VQSLLAAGQGAAFCGAVFDFPPTRATSEFIWLGPCVSRHVVIPIRGDQPQIFVAGQVWTAVPVPARACSPRPCALATQSTSSAVATSRLRDNLETHPRAGVRPNPKETTARCYRVSHVSTQTRRRRSSLTWYRCGYGTKCQATCIDHYVVEKRSGKKKPLAISVHFGSY
jgi:hypothetical protein